MRRKAFLATASETLLVFIAVSQLRNAAVVVSLQHPFAVRRTQGSSALSTFRLTGSELYSEFKVVSKRPSRLVRDPKTGFYRPERQRFDEKPSGARGAGLWNSFKGAVFTGIDGVSSLPDKVRKLRNRDEDDRSAVFDGYRQVQQRIYESGGSPGKKLLREYEQRSIVVPSDSVKPNLFDSIKDGIYKSADIATRFRPAKTEGDMELETFKPVVKPTIAAAPEIQDSLQDLQSSNPVRKAIARARIQEWDRKEKDLTAEIDRYRKSRQVREVIYSAGDAIQGAAQSLVEVPTRATTVVEKLATFVKSIPPAFQETANVIQAIPSQLEQTSNDVRKSIGESIATTQMVVRDVQAIPDKVQRTAEATKDTALTIAGTLGDVTARGKVLLGLEKPVPRPPNSPPPPPTEWNMKEVGWKVAGGLASGAWWVTKGVALASWKGASFAVQKGASALMEQSQNSQKQLPPPQSETRREAAAAADKTAPAPQSKPDVTVSRAAPFFNRAAKVPLGTTAAQKASAAPPKAEPEQKRRFDDLARRNEDLDRQVEEALKLAEEALKMVEREEL
jgi:hypothetical protein